MRSPDRITACASAPAIPDVAVSFFENCKANAPNHEAPTWPKLVALLRRHVRRPGKDGRAWSPTTYRPGTTRANANVESISCFAADFDHATFDDLNDVKVRLAELGLAAVIHSTYSHAPPDDVCFRVVVPFTMPVSAKEWGEIWLRASRYLYEERNDPQARETARIYYLPSAPTGADVFAEELVGAALDPATLPPAPTDARANGHTSVIGETIPQRQRNGTLTSLGGSMRRRGMSEAAIATALMVTNTERCDPPLDEAEVRRIASSVGRYEPESAGEGTAPSLLIVRSLANVQAVPVDWLWPRWLARKKVHILGGHAGDGKSTLTAWLAAQLSRGGWWPDGTEAPIGRTLFLLAEDALDDTVRPRLDQHNADVTMIDAIEAVQEPDGAEVAFNIGRHLPLLEAKIREQHFDLLVIDPLTSFLPKSDRNAEGDIRDLLTPLARLADKTGVAIVGIMHVGKPSGTNRRPVQQLLGATAFGAIARGVWMVAPASPDPADTRRVLGVVKSNLAIKPRALEWSRAEDAPILWHGESTLNIDELISPIAGRPRDDAEEILADALADGPRLSRDLDALAKAHGVSVATWRRAKDALDVESWREPGVKDPPWWSGLPGSKTAWLAAREGAQGEDAHPVHAQVSILYDVTTAQDIDEASLEIPRNGAKMLTSPEGEHLLGQEGAGEDAHPEHLQVSTLSPPSSADRSNGLTEANAPPAGYEENWV